MDTSRDLRAIQQRNKCSCGEAETNSTVLQTYMSVLMPIGHPSGGCSGKTRKTNKSD